MTNISNYIFVGCGILAIILVGWQIAFMSQHREVPATEMAIMVGYGWSEYSDDQEYPRGRFQLPNGEYFEHEHDQYGRVDHRTATLVTMRECRRWQRSFVQADNYYNIGDNEKVEAPSVFVMCLPANVDEDGVETWR